MGTQTSRLILMFTDGMSAGIQKAEHSLHSLEHSIQHLKHSTVGEIGGALGLGLSVEKAVEYGKEAVESYAEQQEMMLRIKNTAKATPEEMDHAHHEMAGLSVKYATDVGKIELALLKLVQTGMTVPEALKKLEPFVRTAKAGYGDVDKLVGIMPRAERQFHLTGDAVDDFLGALVKTSEKTGGGKDVFNQLAESAVAAGPLVERWGWTGINGAKKWLSYVGMLTKELGDSGKASAVMTEIVNDIEKTRTKARFEKAFGKGYDISAETHAAMRRGLDPIKFFIEKAIEAHKRGVNVFQSPELNEALEAFIRRGGDVADFYKSLQQGSKGAVDESLAAQLGSAAFQLGQFQAAWVALRNETGKGLIDAGTIENLNKLIPIFKYIGEEMGKFSGEMVVFFENMKDLIGIFDTDITAAERRSRLFKFLTPKASHPTAPKKPEHGTEHGTEPAKPGDEHGAKPAEHAEPAKPEAHAPAPAPAPAHAPAPAPAAEKPFTSPDSLSSSQKAAGAAAAAAAQTVPRIPLPGFIGLGSFSDALNAELRAAIDNAAPLIDELREMLEFTAKPKVELQAPGRAGYGSAMRARPGYLASSRRRGSHSDANMVPNE
jgi:hypothetical protein